VPTKILLTHNGALRTKYGSAGLRRIRAAARAAVAADKARGVQTRWISLDDARSARSLHVDKVAPDDAAATKAFVDALYAKSRPDYLVLLGSVDVVPMQALRNPLYSPDPRRGDPDRTTPSDLPYACDAAYSLDPGSFRGATRVVGRLPDSTGGDDPATLEQRLAAAASYASSDRATYLPPFALTAADWHGSTSQTLARVVGSSDALTDVPPGGPPWPTGTTRRLLHFFNCHGGAADWRFYGQHAQSYPLALDATTIVQEQRVVAAAECCYGALLYDPAEAGGRHGFADAYLDAGAYGFVGATNVAYGPANGNDGADLVCRFFLQHVLEGCSLGRALLQARQDYVLQKTALSPVDLKTLAQFALYGDASIHAVAKAGPPGDDAAPPPGIDARRRRLRANGDALSATTTRAAARPTELSGRERERIAQQLGVSDVQTFDVVGSRRARPGPRERFHVSIERDRAGLRVVVAREENGRLYPPTVLRQR
jgi:hypothetical protein